MQSIHQVLLEDDEVVGVAGVPADADDVEDASLPRFFFVAERYE
jgi:hypothetical protein